MEYVSISRLWPAFTRRTNGHCPRNFGFGKLSVSFPVTKVASLTSHPQPLRLLLQFYPVKQNTLFVKDNMRSPEQNRWVFLFALFSVSYTDVY